MLAHEGVLYFLGTSLLLVVALYAFNRIFGRSLFGIRRQKGSYLLLVLVIGAGLVVNGVIKDDFAERGRGMSRSPAVETVRRPHLS